MIPGLFQSCQLIGAAIYLHNYYCINKIPMLPEDELHLLNLGVHDDMSSPVGIHDFTSGVNTRESLIRNYFPF